MATTIQISDEVRVRLEKMKIFVRETYNDVLERMMEDEMEINEQTKKELEKRRRSKNFVFHEEVKKRYGL